MPSEIACDGVPYLRKSGLGLVCVTSTACRKRLSSDCIGDVVCVCVYERGKGDGRGGDEEGAEELRETRTRKPSRMGVEIEGECFEI